MKANDNTAGFTEYDMADNGAGAPQPVIATPWQWVDPSAIPPRRWIYDKHYIRRFVSTTFAPGGVGKSSLIIAEAIAIATGRALLEVPVQEPCNVWLWNGEDPREELDRRIAAACMHYGIPADRIEGRLFVDSGRDTPVVVAEKVSERVVVHRPILEDVELSIRENGIGVIVIDPFVSSHGIPENDNLGIDRVVKEWGGIAERCNCAVELVHHVRKPSGAVSDYVVEDARGASALVSGARSARVLNPMSQNEAERLDIEPHHRRLHFRVDDGKGNMSPPAERAVWRKLVSVGLGNGQTFGRFIPEDHVGVVTAWELPDALLSVKPEHAVQVVAAVRANPDYRYDVQARDWIGNLVAEVLGVDVKSPSSRETVKRALGMWFASKVLSKEKRADSKRNLREFIVVGPGWED